MLLRVFSFSFIDMYGNPLDGGKLYTYVTRTTTPATTYSDVEGTLNTNPIILDARGSASIYIEDSNTYRFVLKNREGDVIWSADDITYDNIGQLPDHVIDRIQGYENEVDVSYDSSSHLYTIRLSNYIRERIEKIAEVEQSIDEINYEISGINDQISGINGEISDINDEISGINDTLLTHTQTLEELERTKAEKDSVDELSVKVEKNSNDISTANQKISDLENDVSDLNQSVEKIDEDISGIDSELLKVHQDISDLEEKVGKLVFNAHYEYIGTSTFEEVLDAEFSGADIVNLYTLIDGSIAILNMKKVIFDEAGNDPIAFEFSEVFEKKIYTYRLNNDDSWTITIEDCGGGSGGVIEDAPDDGIAYLRMNGAWVDQKFVKNSKASDEVDELLIGDEDDPSSVIEDEYLEDGTEEKVIVTPGNAINVDDDRSEPNVTRYIVGVKSKSIGKDELKNPVVLIPNRSYVKFRTFHDNRGRFQVVSLCDELRKFLANLGYNPEGV